MRLRGVAVAPAVGGKGLEVLTDQATKQTRVAGLAHLPLRSAPDLEQLLRLCGGAFAAGAGVGVTASAFSSSGLSGFSVSANMCPLPDAYVPMCQGLLLDVVCMNHVPYCWAYANLGAITLTCTPCFQWKSCSQ